jgi:DNA-binding response OmpR family regulator
VKKILVVDDEAGLVDALGEILTEEGYLVHWARNGVDGLQQIEDEPPDLVLLDYMMPVMDGRIMLRKLRENHKYNHIMVIMMTSVTEVVVRGECDIDGYLSKPFSLDALLAALAQTLQRPRAPAAAASAAPSASPEAPSPPSSAPVAPPDPSKK